MSLYARAAVAALASRQVPSTPDVNQMASDAISNGQCELWSGIRVFVLIVMVALNNAGLSSLDAAAFTQGLPDFLTDDPMPEGNKPWGTMNSTNTNQYRETPDTGVTRYYDFTVSKGRCAPDGVEMDCVMANNQYPGPTVEVILFMPEAPDH